MDHAHLGFRLLILRGRVNGLVIRVIPICLREINNHILRELCMEILIIAESTWVFKVLREIL